MSWQQAQTTMQQLTKFIFTILFTVQLLSSFAQTDQKTFSKKDSLFVFNPNLSEVKKKRMADSAFANFSTAPSFVVIIATDRMTGKTKEICTEAPFVEGGLDRNKVRRIIRTNNIKSINRHYYFNTKAALENIGFHEYSYHDLILYGKKVEIRNIVKHLSESHIKQEYIFQGTRKEQLMFAHILFNHGILTTSGDIAGNFMTLINFN